MKNFLANKVVDANGKPAKGIQKAIIQAVGLQRPFVIGHLNYLRKKHPDATAAQLAKEVEKEYMLAVTATGAGVGATAAVPGIGTVTSIGLSAVATVGFLEASALYAQSLAELHGISTEDPEKSRALVMAILMGDEGSSMISALTRQAAGKGAGPMAGWGAAFSQGTTGKGGLWDVAAKQIQKRFLQRMLATQGASMLGRAIPFGIGAAVGGVGNRILGKKVVETAQLAFGPLPTVIPGEITANGYEEYRHEVDAAKEAKREAEHQDDAKGGNKFAEIARVIAPVSTIFSRKHDDAVSPSAGTVSSGDDHRTQAERSQAERAVEEEIEAERRRRTQNS